MLFYASRASSVPSNKCLHYHFLVKKNAPYKKRWCLFQEMQWATFNCILYDVNVLYLRSIVANEFDNKQSCTLKNRILTSYLYFW